MSTTMVNVSMVSLKWGEVLSTLLPGAVALLAISPYFPLLHKHTEDLSGVGLGAGFALLMAAALAGGVLEAFTRVSWEKYWLVRRCSLPKDILKNLNPTNLPLYERGVQGNYKYVTFYANLAWATLLLVVTRLHQGTPLTSVSTLLLAIAVLILLRASHVQWTYFVNYQTKVFGQRK